LDKVPVSDLCEELSLKPTVFCRWQKEFLENGATAFQAQERPHRQVEENQKRIEFLEKTVQTKDEVLAELMAEHVALKKTLGELQPATGCRLTCGTKLWISSGAGRRRPRSASGDSSSYWV
jgi:transposase